MKKQLAIFMVFCTLFNIGVKAQENTSPKVILITLDGFRWQELFTGADSKLVSNETYVNNPEALENKFWRNTSNERRTTLLPFIWTEVIEIGQIHGNINLGSKVNLTNTQRFSYPGYNEILTGNADDIRITSNDKFNNPNTTVLEIVNNTNKYKGKVAAFGSWDVFPYIINEERSGIPVNAGYENVVGSNLTNTERLLNKLQSETPKLWGSVRLDAFTHNYAMEYMKNNHPDLLYISYGETDDFAHDGNYHDYLLSANRTDAMLKELWEFSQKDEYYKGKTIFIITSDHGRGSDPIDTWRHHGSDINGAEQVWFMAFGNGVKALGEVNISKQLYSTQIAPTVLKLLEVKFDKSNFEYKDLSILKD